MFLGNQVKRTFLKPVAFLVLFTAFTAGAHAQLTVSGGLALGYVNMDMSYYTIEGNIGAGGNIYFDYLLPIPIPLSLGLEVGVDTSSFEESGYTDIVFAIPVLVRAAYHFDLMPRLDLYAVGKIGIAFGAWTGQLRDLVIRNEGATITVNPGFAFGIDFGAAYYFTSNFGIFAEIGYDMYNMSAKISWGNGSDTLNVNFMRFFTIGLSFKR